MSMVIELGKLPLLFDETQGTLALPPVTDEQFYEFCQRNPLISAERTAKGSLHLMPPAEAWTDSRGSLLIFDIEKWNSALTKPGITFGASAGFLLPNGAIRAPDASWVSQAPSTFVHAAQWMMASGAASRTVAIVWRVSVMSSVIKPARGSRPVFTTSCPRRISSAQTSVPSIPPAPVISTLRPSTKLRILSRSSTFCARPSKSSTAIGRTCNRSFGMDRRPGAVSTWLWRRGPTPFCRNGPT